MCLGIKDFHFSLKEKERLKALSYTVLDYAWLQEINKRQISQQIHNMLDFHIPGSVSQTLQKDKRLNGKSEKQTNKVRLQVLSYAAKEKNKLLNNILKWELFFLKGILAFTRFTQLFCGHRKNRMEVKKLRKGAFLPCGCSVGRELTYPQGMHFLFSLVGAGWRESLRTSRRCTLQHFNF